MSFVCQNKEMIVFVGWSSEESVGKTYLYIGTNEGGRGV